MDKYTAHEIELGDALGRWLWFVAALDVAWLVRWCCEAV